MNRNLIILITAVFIILSLGALFVNMPEKRNKRVYKEIIQFFPYQLKKELAGVDIIDLKTKKDLDIDNSKVFIVWDDLLKKWGQKHLRLENSNLIIYEENKTLKRLKLNNQNEIDWVKNFFFKKVDK